MTLACGNTMPSVLLAKFRGGTFSEMDQAESGALSGKQLFPPDMRKHVYSDSKWGRHRSLTNSSSIETRRSDPESFNIIMLEDDRYFIEISRISRFFERTFSLQVD